MFRNLYIHCVIFIFGFSTQEMDLVRQKFRLPNSDFATRIHCTCSSSSTHPYTYVHGT